MRMMCVLLLSLMIFPLQAEDIKIHGFVAQGIIQAQDSNLVEDDGKVSLKLTEIGINASYKINSQLRIAGQGVYLNGGNRYPEGLRIDYLFLDWQVFNNANWQLKMQLGRNKNYHWLYSSTRDVPHTRPSIVLPQSMYVDTFRDFALGVDGLGLVINTQNKLGDWDMHFSYGTSPISTRQKNNLMTSLATGDLSHDKDVQLSVYWRPKFSQWQLGISALDVDFSYDSGINDIVFDGLNVTKRFNLHFLYQSENWEITSELVRERTIAAGFFHPLFNSDTTAEGGFVQGRYFINSHFTFMGRLDLYDRDKKDRNGQQLENNSGASVPHYFGYRDQATLGLTWKLRKDLQLQAEYHKTKGTGHLAPYLIPDTQNNDRQYWDIWALQLMYWF